MVHGSINVRGNGSIHLLLSFHHHQSIVAKKQTQGLTRNTNPGYIIQGMKAWNKDRRRKVAYLVGPQEEEGG